MGVIPSKCNDGVGVDVLGPFSCLEEVMLWLLELLSWFSNSCVLNTRWSLPPAGLFCSSQKGEDDAVDAVGELGCGR